MKVCIFYITALISAFSIFGVYASAATLDYTYADSRISPYGKNKKEVIDVAICISDPSLAGKKLTGMKAYINTIEDISEVSMWFSKALTLKSNVNQPDIASFSVTPEKTTINGTQVGELSISLENPYILTEEPLYIGYSLCVDGLSTDNQRFPIIITGDANPNGCYMHMSRSVLKWMDYSRVANGCAYVVATIEGDFPENSIMIDGYSQANASENEDFSITFDAKNNGTESIKSIKYQYGEEGAIKNGSLEFKEAISPSLAISFPLTLSFDGVNGLGTHSFYVNITEVNGKPNGSESSSLKFDLNVYPFVPVNRVLVEEYSGLWCGWCPRGYVAMEIIAEEYGNKAVPVCFHNGDEMTVTQVFPMDVSGYPKGSINRIAELDPYYGSYPEKDFGISYDIENLSSQLAIGDIEINASLEGTIVKAMATAKFIEDYPDADYEIGYILTCNDLSNALWFQKNDYSGQQGYENSRLAELPKWGSMVPGLVYNDVVVDVDGMFGVPGSLPSKIEMAREYTHSYSFDISGNELVKNPSDLNVVAYIVDRQTNRIVNSNIYRFTPLAGISSIEETESVSKIYYDLSGKIIDHPQKGMFILREKMADGKYKTSKILVP